MVKIAFLGKPGSGKGTYAEMLSKEFKIPRIKTGDLLREEIEKKTKFGKILSKYIDKGNLAPSEIVIKIVNKHLKNKKNIIFDGFPRKLDEVGAVKNIDLVFHLKCSDKEMIKRLINRRTCSRCDKVYNLITNPPKKKGICDVCKGKLIIRRDETREGIKKRLKLFKKETMPVINYYKKKRKLIEINGDRPINDVYNEIKIYLKNIINK